MLDRFEQFTNGILRISKMWHKVAAEEMAMYGLNASHVNYLVALHQYPEGLTSSQLMSISQKDKSDVSRVLNSMIKSGLVQKNSTYQKGYGGVFLLTADGKLVADEVSRKVVAAVGLANEHISEEKRAVFYEVLELLIQNISKIQESGLSG